ncbi:inositol 1,4,5-triphosphate receptor 2 [Naegleria gruberi]|uniref:Inositol 1,4,5-triphosphate receptor 2 n=1 Tax=Naegleria gruberi TaxID=5762 RepID=D2V2W7_NAEGR|nr:inositol 1,4,5-triphosphate receptor 2 [Naegleria gruberi]EFC49132.1 inositol 1,4,5-triphosphate receptor 2 [Naegleria gruberi]|eukprot:XP_002681876.1 inositol 1,4,5-triphosphate receptor 2 [Naegleria gruberi strain NEG-M]
MSALSANNSMLMSVALQAANSSNQQSLLLSNNSNTTTTNSSNSSIAIVSSSITSSSSNSNQNLFLRYGDVISLVYEDEKSYLSIRGLNPIRCGATPFTSSSEIDSQSASSKESLFVVMKGGSYSALKRYNEFVDNKMSSTSALGEALFASRRTSMKYGKNILSMINSNKHPEKSVESKKLKIKMEREEQQNIIEAQKALGKVVSYGARIQLLHVQSQEYLTVLRTNAELEKACIAISLATSGSRTFFQIMPHFKFRQENEPVRLSDKIVLFNEKSKHTLHFSQVVYNKPLVNRDNRNEVNATASNSSNVWRINLYTPYSVYSAKAYLKTGDVIRLFHKDAEGYLFQQKEFVKLFTEKYALSSVNALFEIENVDKFKGGFVRYSVPFRLKHLPSGQYLCIQKTEVSDANDGSQTARGWLKIKKTLKQVLRPGLIKEANDDTLFTLHSPEVGASEAVGYGQPVERKNLVRIRHLRTDTWLHAAERSSKNDSNNTGSGRGSLFRKDSVSNRRSSLAPQMFNVNDNTMFIDLTFDYRKKETDVFSIFLASEKELKDFTIVYQIFRIVSNFRKMKKETSIQQPQRVDIESVLEMLRHIIRFCTESTQQDVMKREGIPYPERQSAFRDIGLIDTIMQVIKDSGEIFGKDDKWDQLYQYSFRSIRQITLLHVPNSLYVFEKYFHELQNHILGESSEVVLNSSKDFANSIGQTNTELLIGMIKDNMELLDSISSSQIEGFFNLLVENTRKKDLYLKLLTILCKCEERPIQKNQNRLVELLSDAIQKHPRLFIVPRIEEGKPIVDIPSTGETKSLKHFCETEYFEFMISSIRFFASLCSGKNTMAIPFVQRIFPYDLVLKCIEDATAPLSIRSAFSNLMEYLYVDAVGIEQVPAIKLTRKWTNSNSTLRTTTTFEDYRYQHKRLKDFIYKHFFVSANRKLTTNQDQWFSYQLVKICHKLFLYRAYNPYGDDLEHKKLDESYTTDQEEISNIIHLLLATLKATTDANEELNFVDSENNRLIIKIKNRICDILLYVIDMRIDYRISLILDFFKAKSDDNNTRMMDTLAMKIKNISFFQFDKTDYTHSNSSLPPLKFIPTMLFLLKYQNNELPIKALKILLRSSMQDIELKNNLERLVLLTTPKLVQSYETIFNYYNKLNNLVNNATFSGGRDSKEYKEFKNTIKGILADVKKYGHSAQSILRNLQIHELMILCLTKIYPENIKSNIYQKAVLVLTEFVRSNTENQSELFSHIAFLIGIFSDKLDTSELLCEIVRDNKQLLINLDEKLIHKYIDKIGELGKKSWHLNFLRVLTRIGTSNLQRNQDIIAIYLSTERKDIIVLFNDDVGIEERRQRILNKEYKVSGSLLNYHINMLYLLSDCTLGTVKEAEVKIQSILSFDDCISLLSEKLIPLVRDPLMSLLNELYINTEKKSNDVIANTTIWRLFKRIKEEIKYYIDCKGRNICKLERDVTYQLPPLRNDLPQDDNDDISAEYYVSEKYIYSIIIPLLTNYFINYYSKETLSNAKESNESDTLQIIEEILTNLIELYKYTANENYRKDIDKCFYEIHQRTRISHELEVKFLQVKRNALVKIVPPQAIQNKALTVDVGNEVAKRFKLFIESIQAQSAESIFSDLAKLFVNAYEGQFKTLIGVLQRIMSIGITKDLVETFIGAIETIKYAIKDQKPEFSVENGIPELVLQLLTADYEIVVPALKLSHEMLTSVETRKVVGTIVRSGNYESFFMAMKNRLRQSTYEVKEYFSIRKRNNSQDAQHDTTNAKDVLLFLKLLCEGHYLPNQQMLYNQPFNKISVNLVSECIDYVLGLFKYLSEDSAENFIQAFDTLNEMIQGPCIETSIELASSTRLMTVINEILGRKSLDPEDKDMDFPDDDLEGEFVDHLKVEDELELIEKIIILLTSMLEGGNKISKNHIKKSLDFKSLCKLMILFTDGHSEYKEKIKKILAFENKTETPNPADVRTCIKKSQNIGISIFILLKYLDFDFNEITPDYLDSEDKTISQMDEGEKAWLNYYESRVGTIEVIRDNQLEIVHFKIIKQCRHLQESTKDEFVESCNRESPQTKVKSLFDWTYQIARIEMMHLKSLMDNPNSLKARGWKFIEKNWYKIKVGVFLIAVLINILVTATYTKQFDSISGPVVVPGIALPDGIQYRNSFNYMPIGIVVEILGLILLLLTFGLLGIHLYFFLMLNIKKKFKLEKDQSWDTLHKDREFFRKFALYTAQDPYLWWILIYFCMILIGIFVTPLAYIILTFEIIFLSPDGLLDIIVAIGQNYEKLFYTGVLTAFAMIVHTFLMFSFKYDQFVFNKVIVCKETLTCFMSIVNYGLRGGGFWEDITDPYPLDVTRIFIDLYFSLLIIIILVNVVFGIVLESFSERREEKQELDEEKSGFCFICSNEKSRFDVRANEGITFEGHIKKEHNMWNYVYFLIYLEKKPKDEYTGIEQYVAELAQKQYITFFPTLRSYTLEKAESGEKEEKEEKSANLEEQNINQLKDALLSHLRFSSYMSKDDEIVGSLMDHSRNHHSSHSHTHHTTEETLDFL